MVAVLCWPHRWGTVGGVHFLNRLGKQFVLIKIKIVKILILVKSRLGSTDIDLGIIQSVATCIVYIFRCC